MFGNDPGFGVFGSEFGALGTIVPLIFAAVLGIIAFSAIRGFAQWNRNNGQPLLSVEARLVSKRTHVSHHHHDDGDSNHTSFHSSTSYYVTFEVESGDRMEFRVDGREFGMLAEGDMGKLSFQGTRYHGFSRSQGTAAY
ncbi:DUF2500 family protein [Cohnella sp. CFH 77786]|uniref:DUF2500 domain-containing protein n=1 Tax=Cohnella sp. CFH 77786 TaxID=2662265 RepID=UPI001C60C8C5|nr:DUF2500 domain-containing protein [Cohnella sp. CFH 77786]MBW5446584.1 DUF2500 family protein [Cohnella sp. CFH 77786]